MSNHHTCPHCGGDLPPLRLTVKILGEKVKEPLLPLPDPEPPAGVVVPASILNAKRNAGGES